MKFEGLNGKQYVVSKEIGKGGEGQVFELQDESNTVLKTYIEPISSEKLSKLRHMVASRTNQIETYAAWPIDIVKDASMKPCGFVMKKLVNYVPLHMLFSPMDRKKLFPDKGYNFLIHVARNLASAFHKLHEADLVIGDVNEGNILVNEAGMVALIDCDSFQVKNGYSYYFCEVGIPRYTPPEMLQKGTFDQVIRNINTDSFSLAIIIFQLLFLGRHPFAGINNSSEDIDEEAAIKQFQFAYSIKNRSKKLSPPKDSFDIINLPTDVSDLFHKAFEQKVERPLPKMWVAALDGMSKSISTCQVTKLHTYPSQVKECPWCLFKTKRGILFFLDSVTTQDFTLKGDIDTFINGFKLEKIEFKKLDTNIYNQSILPTPIEKRFYNAKLQKKVVTITIVAIGLGLSFLSLWFIPIFVVLTAIYNSYGNKNLTEELKIRQDHFKLAKMKYDDAHKSYSSYQYEVANYNTGLESFNKLLTKYRNLPSEFLGKKKVMEEDLYNRQFHVFLDQFSIKTHTITSFGDSRKQLLYSNGIKTAADITKLRSKRVNGIGPTFYQTLISWQRQIASKFIYVPDQTAIANGISAVRKEVELLKRDLDADIRREYQTISSRRNVVQSQQETLKKIVLSLSDKLYHAELNLKEFQTFLSK